MTPNEIIEDLLRRTADLERRVAEIEGFPQALATAFTDAANGDRIAEKKELPT